MILCPFTCCPRCGGDILYQPHSGWDPDTDDGDNDGWYEDDGEQVRQQWRTDLVLDGDPWVCMDTDCRARGTWSCDEGGASPTGGDPMGAAEHATILDQETA